MTCRLVNYFHISMFSNKAFPWKHGVGVIQVITSWPNCWRRLATTSLILTFPEYCFCSIYYPSIDVIQWKYSILDLGHFIVRNVPLCANAICYVGTNIWTNVCNNCWPKSTIASVVLNLMFHLNEDFPWTLVTCKNVIAARSHCYFFYRYYYMQ